MPKYLELASGAYLTEVLPRELNEAEKLEFIDQYKNELVEDVDAKVILDKIVDHAEAIEATVDAPFNDFSEYLSKAVHANSSPIDMKEFPEGDTVENMHMVAVNTEHLTQEDQDALFSMTAEDNAMVFWRDTGYFMKLYSKPYYSENPNCLREKGLSEHLINLISNASDNGIAMIEFDCDVM